MIAFREPYLTPVCEAIVFFEDIPHPDCALERRNPSTGEYDHECDCGLTDALEILYLLVGADDEGRIDHDHPLRFIRQAGGVSSRVARLIAAADTDSFRGHDS